MVKKEFLKKTKEDKPVVAICYDFDKTLSPDDMQAQGYIQSLNYKVDNFWSEVNELAEENEMDQNLAYMFKMVEEAEGNLIVKREKLNEYGSKVKLYDGVEDWFERVRNYGKSKGVIVEHYIISSGLKEMIEGTSVAKNGAFEKIYASSFYYNNKGVAVWPSQVVNYTNKTQFLFRIEKGVLDVNDKDVNDYFAPEDIRVPFRNMVYIGDSDTDIPCMKLVNTFGGHSIGVYDSKTEDKTKVNKMMRDNRIKYYVPANYTENSPLDNLIKMIIDRTATNEKLEELHNICKKETDKNDQIVDKLEQQKHELMIDLDNSESFKETQSIISKLKEFTFDEKEKEKLYNTALKNSQVHFILGNKSVKDFYLKLIGDSKDKLAEKIILESKKYYQGKKNK